jgi:hypothetical protein
MMPGRSHHGEDLAVLLADELVRQRECSSCRILGSLDRIAAQMRLGVKLGYHAAECKHAVDVDWSMNRDEIVARGFPAARL